MGSITHGLQNPISSSPPITRLFEKCGCAVYFITDHHPSHDYRIFRYNLEDDRIESDYPSSIFKAIASLIDKLIVLDPKNANPEICYPTSESSYAITEYYMNDIVSSFQSKVIMKYQCTGAIWTDMLFKM